MRVLGSSYPHLIVNMQYMIGYASLEEKSVGLQIYLFCFLPGFWILFALNSTLSLSAWYFLVTLQDQSLIYPKMYFTPFLVQ